MLFSARTIGSVLLLLFFAVGCTTSIFALASITETKTSNQPSDPIDDLYAISSVPDSLSTLRLTTADALHKTFSGGNLPVDTAFIPPVDSSNVAPDSIDEMSSFLRSHKRVQEAKQNTVLFLRQTGYKAAYQVMIPQTIVTADGSTMTTMTSQWKGPFLLFSASLYDLSTKKRMWRSNISALAPQNTEAQREVGFSITKNLVTQLQKDSLLSAQLEIGCPAPFDNSKCARMPTDTQ